MEVYKIYGYNFFKVEIMLKILIRKIKKNKKNFYIRMTKAAESFQIHIFN